VEDKQFYKVVIADARSMRAVPDRSVHLIVTSPPYWSLKKYSNLPDDLANIKDKDEFFAQLSKVWKECFRALKPNCKLACVFEDIAVGSRVYGHPREICLCGDMVRSVEDAGFELFTRIIWWKCKIKRCWHVSNYRCCLNGGFRVNPNWAYVFVFRKYEAEGESRSEVSREEWIGQQWSSGVWYIDFSYGSRPWFKMGHIATFSDKLVERLIKMYTRRGDVVLDPFLGSGTTMMVAQRLGRSGIGYEINPSFLKMIERKVGLSSKRQKNMAGGDGCVIYSLSGIRRKRVREREEKESKDEERAARSLHQKITRRYMSQFASPTRNVPFSSRIQPQDGLGG